MNNDLISREALIEEFKARCICNCDRCKYQQGTHCGLIDNAPTVEDPQIMVPVATVTFDEDKLKEIVQTEVIDKIKSGDLVIKSEQRPHGKWIRTALYGQTCLQCNQCGKADFDIKYDNYCPNCGANMRGGET